MNKDLFSKIGDLEKTLYGKQKQVATYFLSNFEELSFKTAAEIANSAGVSEPTIIRFVKLLGYKGFPQLKDEFQRIILKKLSPSERLHKLPSIPDNNLTEIIGLLFEREIQNLKETKEKLNGKIEKVVRCIIKAKKKYVLGLRSSSACAYLLGRYLDYILPNVITILDGDIRLFEKLRNIGKEDVLIVVSYPRYIRNTVEAIQFAKARNALTITITDSELSPTAQISKFVIIAPSSSISIANSYTACVSVINLLNTLLINMNKGQTEAMLKEWENTLNLFDYFYKNQTNSIKDRKRQKR